MLIDLLALLVVAASAALGWRRRFGPHLPVALAVWVGLAAAGVLLLPLGAAYVSLLELPVLQAWMWVVATALGLPLLGAGYWSYRLGHRRKVRVLESRAPEGRAGRVGGALVGVLAGAPLALLLAWGSQFAQGLGPLAGDSQAARLAREGLRRSLAPLWSLTQGHPVLGALAADGLSDPLGTLQALRAIGERQPVRLLLQDPAFARALIGSYGKAAAYHSLVHQLLRDPEVIRIARERRWLAGEEFGIRDLRAALAERFPALAPRLRALRYDPEVSAALEDPGLGTLVDRGDLPALLADPRVALVLERTLGKVKDEGWGLLVPELVAPPEQKPTTTTVTLSGSDKKYYRWIGPDGEEVISDHAPGEAWDRAGAPVPAQAAPGAAAAPPPALEASPGPGAPIEPPEPEVPEDSELDY